MHLSSVVPIEKIHRAILLIRGQKVMIDCDLAEMYGVKTNRLNEQVKRNPDRFPPDFMFQLTDIEKDEVIANCDHLQKIKFSPYNPYAFTEYGAIMLAGVLNTPAAIQTSVLIVRAFVKLRELIATHKELERKLSCLEAQYDKQFEAIFNVLRKLMKEKAEKDQPPRIGFKYGETSTQSP